jgi:predicted DCC family thiol-disulfide oxidoreductase YuxK
MKRAAPGEVLARLYLRLDLRSLALGRMALALVLLADLVRRIPWLRDLYSNAGLLPNHTLLWRPVAPRTFSVFFMASLPEESALLFLVAFACFFCLLIGYRTRLFQLLSLAMTASLQNRIAFVEGRGGVVLGVLLIWTAFLPLGRRFSVDALLASLRARPHETTEELAAGVPPPDQRTSSFTSLAALGLLLQIAVICGLSFLNASGPSWRQGTAVHYLLNQERIVTGLGVWVREHAPLWVTKLMTRGSLVAEASVPFLVLTPILWRWTRFGAALMLVALNVGIGLLVNPGIFSLAMLAFQPFLITEAQWRLFERLVSRRGRARSVFYDADCGVCTQVVRVLARMDVHRRLRWLSNRELAALPAGVDPLSLERTILVVDPLGDRRWTRSDAFAEIFGALPFGRWWAWPLRLPLVRSAAGWLYDLVARHRTAVSVWLGLAACGVPSAAPPSAKAAAVTPLRAWLDSRLPLVRELAVALVFVILAADVSISNPAVPALLRLNRRPGWMSAAVMYPHVTEGWAMFSPEPPRTDETIFIDAVTRDGRHVDPYNELVSRVATVPVVDVPVHLAQASFWSEYTLQIPGTIAYHQALIEWMLRYPQRTGRPADAITRFDAYVVQRDSPDPAEPRPRLVRTRRFLSWP